MGRVSEKISSAKELAWGNCGYRGGTGGTEKRRKMAQEVGSGHEKLRKRQDGTRGEA